MDTEKTPRQLSTSRVKAYMLEKFGEEFVKQFEKDVQENALPLPTRGGLHWGEDLTLLEKYTEKTKTLPITQQEAKLLFQLLETKRLKIAKDVIKNELGKAYDPWSWIYRILSKYVFSHPEIIDQMKKEFGL